MAVVAPAVLQVVVVVLQQLLVVVLPVGSNTPAACSTPPKQQSNLADWWLQQVSVRQWQWQQLLQPAADTIADNMLPRLRNSLAVHSDLLGYWVGQVAVGQVVVTVVAVEAVVPVDQRVVGMNAVAADDGQTVAADQTAVVDHVAVVDHTGAAMVDSGFDSSFLHRHLAGSSFGHLDCLQSHLPYYHPQFSL